LHSQCPNNKTQKRKTIKPEKMKQNYDDYKIFRMDRALRCFSNELNIEIIKLMEQNEELCANDIVEMLNETPIRINQYLFKLTKWNIIKRERKKYAYYYRLNKEFVKKVIDLSNTLV
jgi:predicted transcriptional regulator